MYGCDNQEVMRTVLVVTVALAVGAGIGVLLVAVAGGVSDQVQIGLIGLFTGIAGGAGGAAIGGWTADRVAAADRLEARNVRDEAREDARNVREQERADARQALLYDRRVEPYARFFAAADEFFLAATITRLPDGSWAPPSLKERFESGVLLGELNTALASVAVLAEEATSVAVYEVSEIASATLGDARGASPEEWKQITSRHVAARLKAVALARRDLGLTSPD